MFWETLLFRSHCTSSWLTSAVLKEFMFFFEKTEYFLYPKIENFEKSYQFTQLCVKFATFSHLKTNSRLFFQKTQTFWKKNKFWTFWEILLIQLHSTSKLLPSAIFESFKVFFGKPTFFSQNTHFWIIWETLLFHSHSTSSWLISDVFKEFMFFFRLKPCIFYFSKLNISRSFTNLRNSASNLPLLVIYKQIRDFFFKKPNNFLEKNKVGTFWEILLYQLHFTSN